MWSERAPAGAAKLMEPRPGRALSAKQKHLDFGYKPTGTAARGTGHEICLSGKPLIPTLLLLLEGRRRGVGAGGQEMRGKGVGVGKPIGKLLKKIANFEN